MSLKRKKQSEPSYPFGLILTAGSHDMHSPGFHFFLSSLLLSAGPSMFRFVAAQVTQTWCWKVVLIWDGVKPEFFQAGLLPDMAAHIASHGGCPMRSCNAMTRSVVLVVSFSFALFTMTCVLVPMLLRNCRALSRSIMNRLVSGSLVTCRVDRYPWSDVMVQWSFVKVAVQLQSRKVPMGNKLLGHCSCGNTVAVIPGMMDAVLLATILVPLAKVIVWFWLIVSIGMFSLLAVVS